jgi:hypothetical protein
LHNGARLAKGTLRHGLKRRRNFGYGEWVKAARLAARRLALLVAAAGTACGCSRSEPSELPRTLVPSGLVLRKAWDLHGIIGTGQSLSVGVEGSPLRATKASYRNLKLDLGSRFFPATEVESTRLKLVPLAEPIRALTSSYPGAYPHNVFGETPHTSMASQITALFLRASGGAGDYVTVHSVVGESGQNLETIGKGAKTTDDSGHAYAASLFEARAIARLTRQARRSYGVAAIFLTHGEADAERSSYGLGLLQLLDAYNMDLPRITGQDVKIPLFLTQQSSCPQETGALARSALAALEACAQRPGELVCVGPRYQYDYAEDGVHLDAQSYDQLGEKYGQAYFEQVVAGRPFRPLAPLRFTRRGLIVSVEFHVPVPPLAWDESLPMPAVRPEWAAGRGFELLDGETPMTIASVELEPTRVELRLQREPTARLTLRYAASAAAKSRPRGSRIWGQLRDSDPFVGATTGRKQPNYAVSFELLE